VALASCLRRLTYFSTHPNLSLETETAWALIAPMTTQKPQLEAQAAKKILIVGGGFAGLNAALRLAKATSGKPNSLQITLLDRHNYHLFQPLLYQVAMAGLSPADIATPIRTVLGEFKNVQVLLAEAKQVNAPARQLATDDGTMDFDYLILACGSQHSYFGHNEWEPFAPGLKTLEQATEVRRRVLMAFEMAEREKDPERIRQLLTFVIVGGGPTGVELAGALAEIARFALSRDFKHIDPRSTRIVLVEAGPRVLAPFDPKLSERAKSDLEKLGVTIWTGVRVTNISADAVTFGSDAKTEKLQTATVVWAAGVKPSELSPTLGVPMDKAGRVIVTPDLSIPGHPNIFVLGDQSTLNGEDGKPLPGLAPVAIQEGRAAANAILADLNGTARKPFRYHDKGQMATIGRSSAVAQTKRFKFGGLLAWYAWLFVHIYFLIGFKNRVIVLIQWFWSYATYKRGAQLIVNKEWRSFSNSDK
jgi:NADH:ubiquinone reductase (H+-translocating)